MRGTLCGAYWSRHSSIITCNHGHIPTSYGKCGSVSHDNVSWPKDSLSTAWKLAKFDSVDDIRSGCRIAGQHQHLFFRNSLTRCQLTISYHFQTRFNFTKITYSVLHKYGHFSIQPSISLLSWSCKHDAISVEHIKPVYSRSVHVIIKFQTRLRSNDGIWWWE